MNSILSSVEEWGKESVQREEETWSFGRLSLGFADSRNGTVMLTRLIERCSSA